MSEVHLPKGVENWPTWKLLLVVTGTMLLFVVLLALTASIRSILMGYIVFSLYMLLGLAMILKTEDVGTAIFETSSRLFSKVWGSILRLDDTEVQKRELLLESGPLGLKFHVAITFIIGLGLIGMSIWAIIMLSRGSFFD